MEVKELAGSVHVTTLRNLARRFGSLYFKATPSDYTGMNRMGEEIRVNNLGKLLFGIPGGWMGYVSAKTVKGKTIVMFRDHEPNPDLEKLFALTIKEALKPGGTDGCVEPVAQRRRQEKQREEWFKRREEREKNFKRREEARPPQQAPQEIEIPLSAEELQKLATEATGIFEQAVKES